MRRSFIFFCLMVFIQMLSYGQIHLGDESILFGDGIIATNTAIIDNSMTQTTLGTLSFEGNDTIYIHSQWYLDSLKTYGSPVLAGSGVTVLQNLFISGSITPTSSLQLVMDTLASISNPDDSFVNGRLFHTGSGDKFYPLGKAGRYTPTFLFGLENSSDEIVGLEVFHEALDLSNLSPIPESSELWYWKVNGNPKNATIQLPLLSEDLENLNINELSILNIDTDIMILTDLGGTADHNNSTILSGKPINTGYLLLGNVPETLSLDWPHNLRTFPNPFDDFIILESPVEREKAVTIYNLKGTLYFEGSLQKKLHIDTSGWKTGLYLMTISEGENMVYRKIVKVK